VFQADIRRALTAFGRTQFLKQFSSGAEAQVIDELVKLSGSLAGQKIGALIVVEREADLAPYMEEGLRIDAKVSKELLYSLFVPDRQNPLHDGAVVIRAGRVEAAGVFLPMSVNPHIDRALGTRHRAALGLSEETDAVVLVVSEERGAVSLALEGDLERDLSSPILRERLTNLLIKRPTRLFRRERSVVTLLSRKTDDPGKDAPPAP
jgi:diadenylate cyclase